MQKYNHCPNCGKKLKTYVSSGRGLTGKIIFYDTCFECHEKIEMLCLIDKYKK